MLQPDDELTICLTANEWNVVLGQWSEGPFRVVAPLIQKIRDQGMAQDTEPGHKPANGARDAQHVSN